MSPGIVTPFILVCALMFILSDLMSRQVTSLVSGLFWGVALTLVFHLTLFRAMSFAMGVDHIPLEQYVVYGSRATWPGFGVIEESVILASSFLMCYCSGSFAARGARDDIWKTVKSFLAYLSIITLIFLSIDFFFGRRGGGLLIGLLYVSVFWFVFLSLNVPIVTYLLLGIVSRRSNETA